MEEPFYEEPKIDFGNIKKHVTDYLKNRLEYFKLTAIEYSATLLESVVLVVVLGVIFLFVWVLANVTAAIAIGESIGKMSIGFLIITLFNLALGLIIIAVRKTLILKPLSNWIVKTLTKSLDADEHN